MSTTRHLVNRQRRLAQAEAAARTITEAPSRRGVRTDNSPPGDGNSEVAVVSARDAARAPRGRLSARSRPARARSTETAAPRPTRSAKALRRLLRVRAPVALCVLVVVLGAFGALALARAGSLRSDPAARNVALTDPARTSEVKGQTEKAVAALFSYSYADTAASDRAASTWLTGKAVQQHHDMLAAVRAQAKEQKLVLTTTATESGVEMIDGSRARVLVYADQSSTRTAGKKPETTYAAAMFAVDVVRRDGGAWQISGIDTFGQGS